MITKEVKKNKICLFCASDYHLEMILLPYIKTRLENTKFIIFTQNNLEESLNLLLTKTNLSEDVKCKIKKINWKNDDKIKILKQSIVQNDNINVIINGDKDYIKLINQNIDKLINSTITIIDCFHISDPEIDIENIRSQYKFVLNTQKI